MKRARFVPYDDTGWSRIGARQIYIIPTRAGVLFGGVCFLMLVGSLNYQNNVGLMFTFLMSSIGLVAMHHTWFTLLGLRISVRGRAPVFAGEDAEFILSFADAGERARGDLRFPVGREQSRPNHIEAGAGDTIRIKVPTKSRGWHELVQYRVESSYPLGLFRAWCHVQTPAKSIVYPRPTPRRAVCPVAVTYRQSSAGDRGVGADDFVGLRGYHPGDSLRHVDWKALGRERGLLVRQFGGDRADQIWLDWDSLPAIDTEARLSLLSRQVLDAGEQDLTYGLRLPGGLVPMGRGDRHKHECLGALALYPS